MSTEPKHRRYTLEEYFELELASEEAFEYFGGEVFRISGVSSNHAQLESNLITLLNNKLRERDCRVYPANMRVKVPTAPPYRYPDLSILCSEPLFEVIGRIQTLTNPTLLIEIPSPLTEAYDRVDKFTHYKSIPSFSEYLLVAQHRPHVTQLIRQTGGSWIHQEANKMTASLHLASLNCTLELNEVYRGVTLNDEDAQGNMPG